MALDQQVSPRPAEVSWNGEAMHMYYEKQSSLTLTHAARDFGKALPGPHYRAYGPPQPAHVARPLVV